MNITKVCTVCQSLMISGITRWHWECSRCGYEHADLEPMINDPSAHLQVDELVREEGLIALRKSNFSILLDAMLARGYFSGRLLDVGCGHGWFLEAAKQRGFDVLGIEPDTNICETLKGRCLSFREGLFPNVLFHNETFDIIVFNDVFEHIEDSRILLRDCKKYLDPNGLLVLNLPSSRGIIYKCAKLFAKIGYTAFFERLWQKGLPSPHIHYFNSENLCELLIESGFEPIVLGKMAALSVEGLFARISFSGQYTLFQRAIIYLATVISLPILAFSQSDIIFILLKKKSA